MGSNFLEITLYLKLQVLVRVPVLPLGLGGRSVRSIVRRVPAALQPAIAPKPLMQMLHRERTALPCH